MKHIPPEEIVAAAEPVKTPTTSPWARAETLPSSSEVLGIPKIKATAPLEAAVAPAQAAASDLTHLVTNPKPGFASRFSSGLSNAMDAARDGFHLDNFSHAGKVGGGAGYAAGVSGRAVTGAAKGTMGLAKGAFKFGAVTAVGLGAIGLGANYLLDRGSDRSV